MHPLTLEFDDETLEDELKSKVLNVPIIRVCCVLTLLLLFDPPENFSDPAGTSVSSRVP